MKWAVDKQPGHTGLIMVREADGPHHGNSDLEIIATVFHEENAGLIAAAPDMYEALKELDAIISALVDDNIGKGRIDSFTLQPARAVIAEIETVS